jgi:hypothetical protein
VAVVAVVAVAVAVVAVVAVSLSVEAAALCMRSSTRAWSWTIMHSITTRQQLAKILVMTHFAHTDCSGLLSPALLWIQPT